MKYIRIAFVHLVILAIIMFLSFTGIYMYKTNPDFVTKMQVFNKNLTYESMLRSSIIGFVLIVAIIYGFYFFMFNLLFRRSLSFKSISYSIGLIILLLLLNGLGNYIENLRPLKLSYIPGSLLFMLVFGGIGLGARAIIEYFQDQEKRKELERKNLQSELNLLRTQINPHFLFNTLNNIDTLIRKDPAKASDLLIKLSEEMRYMLYDSNTEKINLTSEIDFIKGYISLQKLRFKNPNLVEFTLTGEFESILVPPMLFIPFIENAFKHCNLTLDKSIIIRLAKNHNELIFESMNYYDPDDKEKKDKVGGIGLELVKKRLELIYPGKHMINITKGENQFLVSLIILLHGN